MSMGNQRISLSSSTWCLSARALLVWTLTFTPVFSWLACQNSSASAQESSPAWLSGVSTWNGSSYTEPAPSNESAGSEAASNGYTLPQMGITDHSVASLNEPAVTMPNPNGLVVTGPQPSVNPYAALETQEIQLATQSVPASPEVVSAIPTYPSSDAPTVEPAVTPVQHTGPITQQLNSGVGFEQAPLQQEVTSWYQYPWNWMTTGWTNHLELGLDGSQGNAETLAIQVGTEMKRKTDDYTLALDFDYRLVNNRSVVTEDNGRLNIDFDRLLNDSPWAWFTKFGLEFDEFKAFDLRLNLAGGLSYHWIRNDITTFVTRFGAGASQEIGAPDDDWVPEAVFGFDWDHQLNKYNKLKAKVDYFPAWDDFSNFRVVSDFGWEILLDDEEDNLSLKFAITDRYDSTPQGGAEKNDFYYSVLLLVKF